MLFFGVGCRRFAGVAGATGAPKASKVLKALKAPKAPKVDGRQHLWGRKKRAVGAIQPLLPYDRGGWEGWSELCSAASPSRGCPKGGASVLKRARKGIKGRKSNLLITNC